MLDEIFGEDEIITSGKFWIVLLVGAGIITVMFSIWGNKGFNVSLGFKLLSYICAVIVAYVMVLRDLNKNG